jgi:serine/threonine protein kinase
MPGDATPGPADAQEWVRVREIFRHAVTLPAESRPAYLDQACGGDAALRSEVDSLLAAAAQAPASATQQVTVEVEALQPGGHIGHYRVTGKIGEGGMGAVYKAIDTRLNRPVALKVISGNHSGWVQEQRFAREARAASALNHPNIVTIYEFNTHKGLDYLAMEYVEGSTLKALSAGGRTPFEKLLEYARQTAGAIAKAHEAGIVHRDLKPANIMVTGEGLVKVLDFGLAKLQHSDSDPDATETQGLTRAGKAVGTPAYMSPEQVLGEPADTRSDIFSFGVILYELAYGRRPFEGKTIQATLSLITHDDPVAAAKRDPSVPPALPGLIRRCLKKNPAERPQSMAEIAAALSSMAQATPSFRIGRNSRRWLLAILILAVAALAGGLFLSRGKHPAPPPGLTLTYTIEAQKMAGGQPVGDPYAASAADAFGRRFRLRAQSPQAGHFYLINEGPGENGTTRLWVLYPKAPSTPVPLGSETITGWMVFDRNPGTEKLWIVWSRQPVDAIEKTLGGEAAGRVESQDTAAAIQALLAGLKPAQREAMRNGAMKLSAPDGSTVTLGELLELKHR